MPIVNPLETNPEILVEIQAFHNGEEIELSDRAFELIELLTSPKPFDDETISVRMGRKRTVKGNRRPITNPLGILYPDRCEPTVVVDFENPDGIYTLESFPS